MQPAIQSPLSDSSVAAASQVTSVNPDPQQPRQSFFSNLFNGLKSLDRVKRTWLIVILGVFGLGGLVYYLQQNPPLFLSPPLEGDYALVPKKQDDDGIDVVSGFTFSSAEPISEETIKSTLVAEPPVSFKVTKRSSTRYDLEPAVPLEPQVQYTFALQSSPDSPRTLQTWSYQTHGAFRIVEATPGNGSAYVAQNTAIELRFSHDQFSDPEKYVTFEPEIKGRWERRYRTAVFLPQEPLAPRSIYKITIDGKLPLQDSDQTLGDDKVIAFETGEEYDESRYSSLGVGREFTEFGSAETPVIQVHGNQQGLTVKLYKYPNAEQFIKAWKDKQAVPSWAYYTKSDYKTPVTGLAETASFSAPVQGSEGIRYIVFPDVLSEGQYIAVLSEEGKENDPKASKQVWLQVSDLAVHTTLSETESSVWVLDRKQNQAITGAKISLAGGAELGTTNDQGLVRFTTPTELNPEQPTEPQLFFSENDDTPEMLRITLDGQSVFIPNQTGEYDYRYGGWYDGRSSFRQNYWSYVDLDKPVYKPGETVSYWGVIKPRDGEEIPQGPLVARLTNYSQGSSAYAVSPEPVVLEEDGTFIGKISMPQLWPGTYSLRIEDAEGRTITSGDVWVETYVKPAYSINVEATKRAIFSGESIGLTARAAFFDGMPVAQLPLKLSIGEGEPTTHTTSQVGDVTTSVTLKNTSSQLSSSHPEYHYVNFTPGLAEEGDIVGSDVIRVFSSKYLLQSTQSRNGDQSTVGVKINDVNLEGPLSQYPSTKEYTGPASPNVPVKVTVVKLITDKIENGEYYDPVMRTVAKRYRYETREETVREETVNTDQSGEFSVTQQVAVGESYKVVFTMTDPDGRVTQDFAYMYGFAATESTEKYIWLDAPQSIKPNESITLRVKEGETVLPDTTEGKFLLRVSQRGLREVITSTTPVFSYAVSEKDAPNLIAEVVWFDGKRFYETGPSLLKYDQDTARLKIDVTTNQQAFVPGDTVKARIKVTDSDNKPYKGTVNLNVLDKALLALYPQEEQILASLYENIPSGVFFTYTTHKNPLQAMAEGGGGCFLAGTQILLADGTTKAIENVTTEDSVLTRKSTTDETLVAAKVTKTFEHDVKEYLLVNGFLRVTPEHILFINGEWRVADSLQLGDRLLDAANSEITVSSIKREYKPVKVYNLAIENQHTFIADGIYVHNDKGNRSVFKDVVFFSNISTDSDGEATAEFKLPDNLTSWVIRAQGVAGTNTAPKAGSSVSEVTVSQPAAVMVGLAQEYLVGDKPILQLRAYGEDLLQGQAVTFFAEAPSIGLEKRSIQGTAFVPTSLELPPLPLGEHQIIVGVQVPGFEDKLTRTITVKQAQVTRSAVHTQSIANGAQLTWPEAQGLVTVAIGDGVTAPAISVLHQLSSDWRERADILLAKNISKKWLQTFETVPDSLDLTDPPMTIFQRTEGVSVLPYSDPSLYSSMLVAVSGTDAFSPSQLASYFSEVINGTETKIDSSREEKIMATVGLAGVHEPVGPRIVSYSKEGNLTVKEQILLSLGATQVGDVSTARTMLQKALNTAQKSENAIVMEGLSSPDEQLQFTWLAATVAQRLKTSEAVLLRAGAESLPQLNEPANLEKALWATAALTTTSREITNIKVLSETQTWEQKLTERAPYLLFTVPAEQLSSLKIETDSELMAALAADVPVDPSSVSSAVSLSRNYQGVADSTLVEGQLVEVTLNFTLSPQVTGCTQVTDWLPAGLAAVTSPQTYIDVRGEEQLGYPYLVDTQKVSFCVLHPEKSQSGVLRYYARVVNVGEFTAPEAVIQPMKFSGMFSLSQPAKVQIKPVTQ